MEEASITKPEVPNSIEELISIAKRIETDLTFCEPEYKLEVLKAAIAIRFAITH